jgi:hypothetical protein
MATLAAEYCIVKWSVSLLSKGIASAAKGADTSCSARMAEASGESDWMELAAGASDPPSLSLASRSAGMAGISGAHDCMVMLADEGESVRLFLREAAASTMGAAANSSS